MDNSCFSSNNLNISNLNYVEIEKLNTSSSFSIASKVRIHGKLHFLKRPINISDTQQTSAFRKEFEVGFNLDHPGIVRYVAFDEKTYSICTEWVDGVTLSQFIEKNPKYFLDSRNCIRFISQLLDALDYLHSHSVVHLDLKPQNIMITDINNSVKIIDLGLSLTDCFDNTSGFTRQYAAPEQINHNKIDGRTDIYAVGCIVKYIFNKINKNPDCRIRRFIKQCTSHDISKRPSSASNALHLLNTHHRYTPKVILFSLSLIFIVTLGFFFFNKYESNRFINKTINKTDSLNNISSINDSIIQNNISDTIITTESESLSLTPRLTPAQMLDTAEARMGMFANIRGHYELKKEWFSRQYNLFDSLRTQYLLTDTAQKLGDYPIHQTMRNLIERDKYTVAQKFPNTDMNTIMAVAQDINIVIIYLCYSDSRLYRNTNAMNHQWYDFAHRKAKLLK